ncbi:MAG: thioesterase superfamily protein [Frankiales bacterium]|nr:thioesterase superfamily protein [Frankiales bacterium]
MTSPRWPAERLDPEHYAGPGHDLPVFYGDLDTGGHLNNVAFGRFFEQSRFEAHRRIGLPKLMADHGGRFLVARVAIDYLREAHFGAPLHLRTRVHTIGTSSAVEHQGAWQHGECVALAETVMVYVSDAGATPLPDHLRAALEQVQPA